MRRILKCTLLLLTIGVLIFSLASCGLLNRLLGKDSEDSGNDLPIDSNTDTDSDSSTLDSNLTSDSNLDSNPAIDSSNPSTPPADEQTQFTITFSQGEPFSDVVFTVNRGDDFFNLPVLNSVRGYDIKWESVDLTNISSDIVVRAIKTPKTYQINYVIENGTNSGSNPTSYTVESNEQQLFAPISTNGAEFYSWYTTPDFKDGTQIASISECYYKDITLYACWLEYKVESIEGFETVINNGAVSFKGNMPSTYSTLDFTEIVQVSEGCSWKLYSDKDYNVEIKNKIVQLNDGENKLYIVVNHPNKVHSASFEVVIHRFEMLKYEFISNNEVIYTGYAQEGDSITLPDLTPQKNGYSFLCWTLNGDEISFPYVINKPTSFEARFITETYRIEYSLDGGTNNESNKVSYKINDTVYLSAPTKQHYAFLGWYDNPEFAGENLTAIEKGRFGDITLYAKWVPESYNIIYVLNRGENSQLNPHSYNIETEVVFDAPTRAGCSFLGWYSDANFTNKVTKIPQGSVGIVYLYAKWELGEFYINYTLNNGTQNPLNTKTKYTADDLPLTLYAPSRNGYSYGEWYTENGLGEPINEITIDTIGNYDLYACYYNISYAENATGYTINEYKGTHLTFEIPDFYNGSPVTAIANKAFAYSLKLEKLTVPDTITHIYRDAFYGCSNLDNVYIKDLKKWCEIVFQGPASNPLYNQANLYLNSKLVKDLVIPSDITTINSSAFYNCTSLKTIYIPSTVAYLGGNVFNGCASLTAINFQAASSVSATWHSDWNSGTNANINWNYKFN